MHTPVSPARARLVCITLIWLERASLAQILLTPVQYPIEELAVAHFTTCTMILTVDPDDMDVDDGWY